MSKNIVDCWRLFHIGHFYTELAMKMFGGEKKDRTHDVGDIENFELGARLEVKGRSNHNILNIDSGQLDRALDKRGFPFSDHLYAIFSYRNKKRGDWRPICMRKANRASMNCFLALNTMQLFLVDVRVIAAVRSIDGVRMERRASKIKPAVKMNKETLLAFASRPEESLKRYRLRGFKVAVRKEEFFFLGQKMIFDMIAIVHRNQLEKLLSVSRCETSEKDDDILEGELVAV
jgi:hypothetical protein